MLFLFLFFSSLKDQLADFSTFPQLSHYLYGLFTWKSDIDLYKAAKYALHMSTPPKNNTSPKFLGTAKNMEMLFQYHP